MATLYDNGKNALLTSAMASLHTNTTNIKAVLIKDSYIQNATHVYSNLTAHFASTVVTLSGCTVTGKTFDAADVTFTTVPVLPGVETIKGLLVFYEDGGTRYLLSFSDGGTGFPFTPNGANVVVTLTNIFVL